MAHGLNIAEFDISTGWSGTHATINQMRRLVSLGKRNWPLIKAASDLARSCPGHKNRECWAQQAFGFVRSAVKYVPDPQGIELVEHPIRILERGASDCDGMSILFNTLCEILGLRTYFKTIKADGARPNEFSHVYSLVEIPGVGRVPADCSFPNSYLGWEARIGAPFEVWPGSNEL